MEVMGSLNEIMYVRSLTRCSTLRRTKYKMTNNDIPVVFDLLI